MIFFYETKIITFVPQKNDYDRKPNKTNLFREGV